MHEGHRERLRAEFMQSEDDALPDHRLLELLLTYAIPRKNTNELAHALLAHFGSLEAVLFAESEQLQMVAGIGKNAAAFLHLQGGMVRRISQQRLEDVRGRKLINTPLAAAKLGIARLGNRAYENVQLVCLNAKRYVDAIVTLSKGVVAESQIYPRQVVETALLRRAHSVMLFHNHPSGNPTPSGDDKTVTEAIRAALEPVEIPLLDHIIVGEGCVYSFSAGMILAMQGDTSVSMTLEEYAEKESEPGRFKVMERY